MYPRIKTILFFFNLILFSAVPSSSEILNYTVFNSDRNLWAWEGNGYVSLMWKRSDHGCGYDLYRRSLKGSVTVRLNDEPLYYTSATDLTNGLAGHYEYFVRTNSESCDLVYQTAPLRLYFEGNGTTQNKTAVLEFEDVREHITTDLELRNELSMTLENIENFLFSINSFLAFYVTEDAFGTERTAAEIIYNAANDYGINPQSLLVTLQKEQGLLSTPPDEATQFQLDLAMGYAPGNPSFRGFGIQVDRAAWQIDKYYRDMETVGTTVSGWGVMISKATEDCLVITPRNMATAALYTYTPLAGLQWGGCTPFGGNFLYWDLFYNVYSFDAGPEGDFEIPEGVISCALSGENTGGSFSWEIFIWIIPAVLAALRYGLRRKKLLCVKPGTIEPDMA